MLKFNLLTEDLIRYKRDDGKVIKASLPEVFAALMADYIASFPALRPHQRHAWHAFLVQLGAIAMHKAGMTEPPTDAGEWRRIIRALTKDEYPNDEPWHLVVDDITMPAFLQPPTHMPACKKCDSDLYCDIHQVGTPAQIDSPDTAKNHDLKRGSILPTELDDWTFALITGQTNDAHFLQNPAISRISGGGSRLAFSVTPSTRMGVHAKRDIFVLLQKWDSVGENCGTTTDGHALLWTVLWDGKKALYLRELHPLYIEISRRRRLALRSERLYARKASGNSARIAEREKRKGRTGDPWIPINLRKDKAMTLPKTEGFTYRQIANLLKTGDWELPLLCKPTRDESASPEPLYLVARGMAPGKDRNRTGGYYERVVPISSNKVKMAMMRREDTQELGTIAEEMVGDVGKVERALKDAIATFIVEGDDIYNKDKFDAKKRNKLCARKEIKPWLKQLDEIVDTHFFAELQSEFELDRKEEQQARRDKWLWNDTDGVIDHARRILTDAQNALKCPSVERYRACANSDDLFVTSIQHGRRGFPNLGYTDKKEGE